jgi:hypothetical protein
MRWWKGLDRWFQTHWIWGGVVFGALMAGTNLLFGLSSDGDELPGALFVGVLAGGLWIVLGWAKYGRHS